MADPKKNPLIGAFRTPVPNTPPNTPTPPAEQPPPSIMPPGDQKLPEEKQKFWLSTTGWINAWATR